MEAVDVLYEAVRNSLEAGADRIEIRMAEGQDAIRFTVSDNGCWNPPDDPFREGASSRGEGRGMGLALIRALDGKATIVRDGDATRLSFSLSRPLDGLERMLSSLFSLTWSRGVDLAVECGDVRLTTQDMERRYGELDRAASMAAMARDIHLEHK